MGVVSSLRTRSGHDATHLVEDISDPDCSPTAVALRLGDSVKEPLTSPQHERVALPLLPAFAPRLREHLQHRHVRYTGQCLPAKAKRLHRTHPTLPKLRREVPLSPYSPQVVSREPPSVVLDLDGPPLEVEEEVDRIRLRVESVLDEFDEDGRN